MTGEAVACRGFLEPVCTGFAMVINWLFNKSTARAFSTIIIIILHNLITFFLRAAKQIRVSQDFFTRFESICVNFPCLCILMGGEGVLQFPFALQKHASCLCECQCDCLSAFVTLGVLGPSISLH